MLPIAERRSVAWSTMSLAAVPWGSTLHRFMMPLYSPKLDADLQACQPFVTMRVVSIVSMAPYWTVCSVYWSQ